MEAEAHPDKSSSGISVSSGSSHTGDAPPIVQTYRRRQAIGTSQHPSGQNATHPQITGGISGSGSMVHTSTHEVSASALHASKAGASTIGAKASGPRRQRSGSATNITGSAASPKTLTAGATGTVTSIESVSIAQSSPSSPAIVSPLITTPEMRSSGQQTTSSGKGERGSGSPVVRRRAKRPVSTPSPIAPAPSSASIESTADCAVLSGESGSAADQEYAFPSTTLIGTPIRSSSGTTGAGGRGAGTLERVASEDGMLAASIGGMGIDEDSNAYTGISGDARGSHARMTPSGYVEGARHTVEGSPMVPRQPARIRHKGPSHATPLIFRNGATTTAASSHPDADRVHAISNSSRNIGCGGGDADSSSSSSSANRNSITEGMINVIETRLSEVKAEPIASLFTTAPTTSPPHITTATSATNTVIPATTGASTAASSPLLIINTDSASLVHDTGSHQENRLRTELLSGPRGCLRRGPLRPHVVWEDEANIVPAALADLLRVHEYTYLAYLEQKVRVAASTNSNGSSNSNSTSVASDVSSSLPPFYAPPGFLDVDTPLSPSSLDAAKRFCGGAMLAVDRVLQQFCCPSTTHLPCSENPTQAPPAYTSSSQTASSAFVIGRPPGHHAGPSGCVPSSSYWSHPGMASSGFCLLNTVAVAAAYARYRYSAEIETNAKTGKPLTSRRMRILEGHPHGSRPLRIAIVDIDIHHGNGTEEIVRSLRPRQVPLPLPSSWAPVTQLCYKPWLNEADHEDVCFASLHLYAGERFYPCSGADSFGLDQQTNAQTGLHGVKSDASGSSRSSNKSGGSRSTKSGSRSGGGIYNIGLTAVGPGPWDVQGRARLSHKQREALCKRASEELRSRVSSDLLPQLRDFRPDLLLISAGFDAHYDDMYHYLSEDDFYWLTSELRGCAGACVSIMEGGYSLQPVLVAGVPSVPDPASLAAALRDQHQQSLAPPAQSTRHGKSKAMAPTAPSAPLDDAGSGAGRHHGDANTEPSSLQEAHDYTSSSSHLLPATPEDESAMCLGRFGIAPPLRSSAMGAGRAGATSSLSRRGDGGLVKAVLAHACALTGLTDWAVSPDRP